MKMYLVAVMFIVVSSTLAQSSVDTIVASKVRMMEEGKATQVKLELPELVAKYPNHPGVLYLQGLLATNAAEAAKYYQMVLDNFPKSEWADDALYRIYLYYYSLGLARTAELKMQQLRKDYPHSPYARGGMAAQQPPDQQNEEQPAPGSAPTPPPPGVRDAEMPTEGTYAVQVGAFAVIDNAMRMKSYFEELGYPVEVQNKVRGGSSLHLVWVGNFSTSDEARKFSAEIKAKHKIESIIVTR